jgi:hypothetical protein
MGRRNAGVHREVAITHRHGPIYHHCPPHEVRTLCQRQEDGVEMRRDQIAWPNEAPIRWIIVICEDQVVRWQRRPADIIVALIVALTPIDPSRTPVVVRDPDPAESIVGDPTSIMVRYPAPFGLGIVGDPVPAVVVRIDPMSDRVGPPIARDTRWGPDRAPTLVRVPSAVRLQRLAESPTASQWRRWQKPYGSAQVRMPTCIRHGAPDRIDLIVQLVDNMNIGRRVLRCADARSGATRRDGRIAGGREHFHGDLRRPVGWRS